MERTVSRRSPNSSREITPRSGRLLERPTGSRPTPTLDGSFRTNGGLGRTSRSVLGFATTPSGSLIPSKHRHRNFSPRLGLSYAPGDHKTVMRSGFGLYYDRVPLRAVANALRGAGTDYKSITLQRAQVRGAGAFPTSCHHFRRCPVQSRDDRPEHQDGYGIQANLEVEREIATHLAVSAGYLHMRGVHIIMQRNLNVPTLTAAQDPVNLGRPNPNFGNINQYSGQGDSYYDGMTLSMEHRGSSWASLRVSYTLSKAIDNTGNAFFSSPQNNFNIRDDRGLSDNDQRHRLTVSGQLTVPRSMSNGSVWSRVVEDFQLSSIFTYGSPYPFNIVTGGQTMQTTAARPAGFGRNTGRGSIPPHWTSGSAEGFRSPKGDNGSDRGEFQCTQSHESSIPQ